MSDISLAGAAKAYVAGGMYVFPLQPRRKEPLPASRGYLDATNDYSAVAEAWSIDPNLNIGISPEPSGFFVLDVDPRNGGTESWNRLAREYGIESLEPTVMTSGGGSHYYFQLPPNVSLVSRSNAFGAEYPGIDLKCKGGYVVAPPSLHPDGEAYRALANYPPRTPIAAPQSLIELLTAAPETEPVCDERVIEGGRNSYLTSVAGRLRNSGLTLAEMTQSLQALNVKNCHPPLSRKDVKRIAGSIHKRPIHGKLERGELTVTRLSDVQPESVDWLWADRVAFGKVTVFAGDPGAGKSFASISIASAVTRGLPLPGETASKPPADVLIVSYEDGAADTIRPRADLCGADTARIHLVEGPRDADGHIALFSLADLPRLEEDIKKRPNRRLLIIDPVGAVLAGINSHRDSDLRAALAPLAALAERYHIAVILVAHLNKDEQKALLYRVGGSIGFVGLARSVLMFGVSKNTGRRACVLKKSNLQALAPPVEYKIDSEGFHWVGIAPDLGEESLFGVSTGPSGTKTKNDEADDFLRAYLAVDRKPSAEVYSEASRRGIGRATLSKASYRLRVVKRKAGLGEGWFWKLPDLGTT